MRKSLFRMLGISLLSGVIGIGIAMAQGVRDFTLQTLNGPYSHAQQQGKTLVYFFSFPG